MANEKARDATGPVIVVRAENVDNGENDLAIVFKTTVTITKSFRDIFKRQRYENLVLSTLNRSTQLIPNLPLSYVEEQSNGQSDFIDTKDQKYDVKLLMDPKQGAYIGDPKNDLMQWFRSMMNETAEFSNCIVNRDLQSVVDTRFYKLTRQFIGKFKEDEIGILFVPYPVVHDYGGSIFLQFATDFIQAVFNQLDEENAVTCKRLLFLYPSMESGKLVLRDAHVREYIMSPEITEYINYSAVPSVE